MRASYGLAPRRNVHGWATCLHPVRPLDRVRDLILQRWRRRRLLTAREWAFFILPWVLVLVGLLLMAYATAVDVRRIESQPFAGQLAPLDTLNVTFSRSGFAYTEVVFEAAPSCSLRVYVLTPAGASDYAATGNLPDYSQAFTCDRLGGFHRGDIALLVFRNPSNATVPYAVRLDLYITTQPLAWLVFPGLLAFFAGAIPAIMAMLRAGLTRLVDEFAEREEYDPSRAARKARAARSDDSEASAHEGPPEDEGKVQE